LNLQVRLGPAFAGKLRPGKPSLWSDFGDLPVAYFGQAGEHVFEAGLGINAATAATFVSVTRSATIN